MRRILRLLALLLGIGIAYYAWFRPERPNTEPSRRASSPVSPGSAHSRGAAAPSPRISEEERATAPAPTVVTADPDSAFPIAAPLNAPGSTIARDLEIVSQLFDAWQSNFPREGNPVGENAEITAALMGANRLELALIPKGHRALNENGELCDRWGSPFRFHQLSGTKMEIRSAGPDRTFATDDDAVWTPQ